MEDKRDKKLTKTDKGDIKKQRQAKETGKINKERPKETKNERKGKERKVNTSPAIHLLPLTPKPAMQSKSSARLQLVNDQCRSVWSIYRAGSSFSPTAPLRQARG